MLRQTLTGLGISCALALVGTVPLQSQIRASERGSVSQTVDGTVITVDYSRPQARGRSPIFGGQVYWGEVWTPGANWATTFEFSRDVTLDGHEVAAGKYSAWLVVQPEEWTLVLDPEARLFHLNPPDSSDRQTRFAVVPEDHDPTEVLTFTFPEISTTGTTMRLAWGAKQLSLRVGVKPSRPTTLAEDQAAPYLGHYQVTWTEQPDDGSAGEADGPQGVADFDVYYENGSLMARMDPAPPWLRKMVLIRIADDWFNPGLFRDGELYDVLTGLTFEFAVKSESARGFDLRWITDEVLASAVRQD